MMDSEACRRLGLWPGFKLDTLMAY